MSLAITANTRFKQAYGRYVGYSILTVAAIHLLLFSFTPPFVFKPFSMPEEFGPTPIDLPDVPDIPAAPLDIPRPPIEIVPAEDGQAADEVDIPRNVFDFPGSLPQVEAPTDESPITFFPFDEAPVLIRGLSPVYPELARLAGIEGTVELAVLVGVDGSVLEAKVLKSDVTGAMESAATAAVMQFKFRAARQRTTPVRAWVTVPITFRLH